MKILDENIWRKKNIQSILFPYFSLMKSSGQVSESECDYMGLGWQFDDYYLQLIN